VAGIIASSGTIAWSWLKFGDDFVGAGGIVVAIPQEQRLADAILEAALLINGVADVEQTTMRVQVHEDADAARSVAAQRDDNDRAIAVKVGAFVERLIRMRIEFQRGRVADGKRCVCAG